MHSGKSCVAEVAKTFGINGELVLKLYDSFPDEIDVKEPIFIEIDGILVPFYFKTLRFNGKNKAIAVFDDFETEALASELVACKAYLSNDQLDGDSSMPSPADLFGYTVYDEKSQKDLGIITEFFDYPNNPLFQITSSNGDELLLPIHEDYITTIDDKKKSISVVLPEGFLEIFD